MDGDGHVDARRRANRQCTGTAWFDHQWGDFIAVGGGGWDWFAVNLADGSDLMAYLIRAPDGSTAVSYATLARRRLASRI